MVRNGLLLWVFSSVPLSLFMGRMIAAAHVGSAPAVPARLVAVSAPSRR